MDPKLLDDLASRVIKALPDDLHALSKEFKTALHHSISHVLSKSDLVTREEFEVQAGVLARSREKLEALESRLADLERQLQ